MSDVRPQFPLIFCFQNNIFCEKFRGNIFLKRSFTWMGTRFIWLCMLRACAHGGWETACTNPIHVHMCMYLYMYMLNTCICMIVWTWIDVQKYFSEPCLNRTRSKLWGLAVALCKITFVQFFWLLFFTNAFPKVSYQCVRYWRPTKIRSLQAYIFHTWIQCWHHFCTKVHLWHWNY